MHAAAAASSAVYPVSVSPSLCLVSELEKRARKRRASLLGKQNPALKYKNKT